MKKATVITASYNSADTIVETFESLLLQRYRPLEYVVIDGNSTDGTQDVIEGYRHKFAEAGIPFSWLSEPDKGIFDAWNKGLSRSTGDWIAFLGADDRYKPDAISVLMDAVLTGQYDFVTARCRMVDNGKTRRYFGEPWSWKAFRKEMRILHAGGFHNAAYFENYGGFDTDFRIAGDYELLLRAGSKLKVAFVDQELVEMDASGISSTNVDEALQEARWAKLKNGARGPLAARWDAFWVRLKIRLKQGFHGVQ